MTLEKIPFQMTVCKATAVEGLDYNKDFYFIGKTDSELSLVCRTEDAPDRAAARADGLRKFIMFLHYPPTGIPEDDSPFTAMAEEYGAEQVIYAHCHGAARFHDSIQGEKNGVEYSLVSGDWRRWQPLKVLD